MAPRRLCFVGWADHVHLERWAGYFAQRDDAVSVVSFSGPGRYPAGVEQRSVGLAGRGPRWGKLRLRYLLWRLRPDLVHVHWAHFAPIVRRAWKGPLVVTAWGSDVYRRDRFSAEEWSSLGEALRTTDLVTCDSEDLAALICGEFRLPPERVQVIQWGVDTDLFTPQGPDLRAKLGLPGREVVYSARNFAPVYNQETVLRAFALLRTRRPEAFLLMKFHGGEPDYLARIRALIEQLHLAEHVRILDSMPYEQLPDVYRTADVSVSVPLSDATPMSLLEAMASGSIVVVGDLPSLREWVDHGRTGLLLDPVTPETLADALDRALAVGLRGGVIRDAARRLVVDRAGQHVHMGNARACYEKLIGASR